VAQGEGPEFKPHVEHVYNGIATLWNSGRERKENGMVRVLAILKYLTSAQVEDVIRAESC
jgi:hypothetical protein